MARGTDSLATPLPGDSHTPTLKGGGSGRESDHPLPWESHGSQVGVGVVIEEARRRREEAYARKQQNKKQSREVHKRARTYGLPKRHSRKLEQIRRRDHEHDNYGAASPL